MAKGAYLGINDTARKVKNIYVGVDGVARKIKKAYIGDENGLARLCWSGSEVPFVSGLYTTGSSNEKSITISGLGFVPTHAVMVSGYSSVSVSFVYIGTEGSYLPNHTYSSTSYVTISGNSVTFSFSSFRRNSTYYYYLWSDVE